MKRFLTFTLAIMVALGFAMAFGSPVASFQAKAFTEEHVYFTNETNYGGQVMLRGGNRIGEVNERIDFHRREIQTFVINPNMPTFLSTIHCGVTGGGNLIAFNQRIHRDLIPGHNPGMQFGTNWLWSNGPLLTTMFDELHTRMGRGHGVTIDQYINGIRGFAHDRDFQTSLFPAYTGNYRLSTSFFNNIRNGVPISLFMNDFNFSGITSNNGHDMINMEVYAGRHIVVAYGYKIVSYFDVNNVIFREETFINIQTGYNLPVRSLIRLHSGHGILEAAWGIRIN